MTIGELEKKYSFIPWVDYFNQILKPHTSVNSNESITVASTVYLDDLEKLMDKTDKRYCELASSFIKRTFNFNLL